MVLSKQEGSTPLPRDAKGKRMHEDTELAGVQGTAGISRRDMLRKSAVVGGAGALMWAAPSITKYGSAAFGQTDGTPLGRDLSYIAVLYDCGGTLYAAKFDFAEGDKCDADSTFVDPSGPYCVEKCESNNTFKTPECTFDNSQASHDEYACDDGADGRFTIEYIHGLKEIKICLKNPMNDSDCFIVGTGVGKCGAEASPQVDDPCVDGIVDGTCVTFKLCDFQE